VKLKDKHLCGTVSIYKLCKGLRLRNDCPLEVEVHQEEDGTFFVKSPVSHFAYGTGHSLEEAVNNYKRVVAERYYEALGAEKNSYQDCGVWLEDEYRHLLLDLRLHL
jgi:predicted RNase H-like HicB family nuclease